MSKIWSKDGTELNSIIEEYTVGNDNKLDEKYFFKYDIEASIVHVKTLSVASILNFLEADALMKELSNIKLDWEKGHINVNVEHEDCHTTIERILIERLGLGFQLYEN